MMEAFIPVARPQVGEAEIDAVVKVLRSGQFVSGTRVAAFEEAFADYAGTAYAVAVNSGTSALYLTLEALGIGPGDEVVVPPLTFFATVSAVLYTGARPVFADIDLDDLCMSPDSLEAVVTSRTRAVIPVHLFGAVAKMDRITAIAHHHHLAVLEDCAQAHGSAFDGKRVGSLGEAGAFSFFATKHMTTGEGGMVTTNDNDLAARLRMLRSHGMTDRDTHELLGYNHRMTEMEAAMGLVQLERLEDLNARRIANSQYLAEALADLNWAVMPVGDRRHRHTFFWCPLLTVDRDIAALKKHLQDHCIGFRHRYDEPLYHQPVLSRQGIDCRDLCLPNVERVAGRVIGLPNHPGLTRDELDRVVDVVRRF